MDYMLLGILLDSLVMLALLSVKKIEKYIPIWITTLILGAMILGIYSLLNDIRRRKYGPKRNKTF